MSKIKKVCFIVIFAIGICFFMKNVSSAGWVNEGGFRRNRYTNGTYTWDKRPVQSYEAYNNKGILKTYYKIHITNNIYIDRVNNAKKRCYGPTYPKLNWHIRSIMFTTWANSR